MKFEKIIIPSGWQDTFTKYPNGRTIFESLSKTITSVNESIDYINDKIDNGINIQMDEALINIENNMNSAIEEIRASADESVDNIETNLNTLIASFFSNFTYGTPIVLELLNGWGGELKLRKNPLGQVHIYGELIPGTVNRGTVLSNIPIGYRPPFVTSMPVQSANAARGAIDGVAITTAGNITLYDDSIGTQIGTSNIRINYVYQTL